MEQPENSQEPPATPPTGNSEPVPAPAPAPTPEPLPDPVVDAPPKVELPDHKNAIPIPENFRLPFMGKMATPTAVPSRIERQANLDRLQKRRRRRGFLMGLLVGQILIIALDLGGEWFLRTHPGVKLQAPIRVASIVFLGMAVGAATMLLAVALIYGVMGFRALFRKKAVAATGRGIQRIVLTALTLGVTMGVILGTAWFMIPPPQWGPTVEFAKERGRGALDSTKEQLKGWFRPSRKP